jgi:hypothetical protein
MSGPLSSSHSHVPTTGTPGEVGVPRELGVGGHLTTMTGALGLKPPSMEDKKLTAGASIPESVKEMSVPSQERGSFLPPPPVIPVSSHPVSTKKITEEEVSGKTDTELRELRERFKRDRKTCVEGQKVLEVGQDMATTLRTIDDNIKVIERKLEVANLIKLTDEQLKESYGELSASCDPMMPTDSKDELEKKVAELRNYEIALKNKKGFENENAEIQKNIAKFEVMIGQKEQGKTSLDEGGKQPLKSTPLTQQLAQSSVTKARAFSTLAQPQLRPMPRPSAQSSVTRTRASSEPVQTQTSEKVSPSLLIVRMRAVTDGLKSNSKIREVKNGEDVTFVLGDRETGIPKYMSILLGRGTGYSAESKEAAIGFLGKIKNEMDRLKDDNTPQGLADKAELLKMLQDLSSSEWFHGVLHYHKEVGQQFFEVAKEIIPGQGTEVWIQLAMNLEGTNVSRKINALTNLRVQGTGFEKLKQLEGKLQKLQRQFDTNADVSSVCSCYDQINTLVEETKANTVDHLLPDGENAKLLELQNKYKKLYEESVGKSIGILTEELPKDINSLSSPGQLYALRESINALQSEKHEEPYASQIAELSAQCDAKLIELGKSCVETLKTSADKDLLDKAGNDFRTCFRLASLVGKGELKASLEQLPESGLKTGLQSEIKKEERKLAFEMSMLPGGAKASLSAADKKQLEAEQKAYMEYKRKFDEVKDKQDKNKVAKRQSEKIPFPEADNEKLPEKPLTPILDFFSMAGDFETQSTIRLVPYFKDRQQLFVALEEFADGVSPDQAASFAGLVARLISEQKNLHEPEAKAKAVQKSIQSIQAKLEEKIKGSSLTIVESMKEVPPQRTVVSSTLTDEVKQTQGENPKILAQDLQKIFEADFLSMNPYELVLDPDLAVSLAAKKANQLKNLVEGDIFSSKDVGEVKKRQEFWVNVAAEAEKLGNYEAVNAILSAISSLSLPMTPSAKETKEKIDFVINQDRGYAALRKAVKDKVQEGLPVLLPVFLIAKDITMSAQGNTGHDKAEVDSLIMELPIKLKESMAGETRTDSLSSDIDLKLETAKEVTDGEKAFLRLKYVSSRPMAEKFKKITENLSLTGSVLSGDTMAAIDMEEKLELNVDGFLVVSKPGDQGVIARLKIKYKETVMQPALQAVADLSDVDSGKREKALQDLEKISPFLTPKSRKVLQEKIQAISTESGEKTDAVLVLNLFNYAKELVGRLSTPESSTRAFEVLQRILSKLNETQRKELVAQMKSVKMDKELRIKVDAFLKTL